MADPHRQEPDLQQVTCVRCLKAKDVVKLDRLLWCEGCRARARNRAGWWGWLGGVVLGGAVAAYVWLVIRPSDLVIGGWVATVAAAVWIGSKVCRELAYGVMRFRNVGAVDALPATSPDRGPNP